MSIPYVPVHLHTEYSLLDGAIRINDLCKFSVENGFPAVAITDHGVMYGDMELYTTAKENGVKPILGCEFYVHNGDIEEKDRANKKIYSSKSKSFSNKFRHCTFDYGICCLHCIKPVLEFDKF